jgi:hypothetical protein
MAGALDMLNEQRDARQMASSDQLPRQVNRSGAFRSDIHGAIAR